LLEKDAYAYGSLSSDSFFFLEPQKKHFQPATDFLKAAGAVSILFWKVRNWSAGLRF
jgi:hypothetical protein